MERVNLFEPKFSGQRFDDHTLPFDLLDDIATYQDLLFQVAKDIYYQENNTKRVPNGFGQGVYLKLADIEEGSAIPRILLAAATFIASNINTLPFFERAQQQIEKVITLADNGSDISGLLSPDAFSYFNRIGKNLKDDEVINFNPNVPQSAKLTQINRRKIVLASPNATSVESEIYLRGHITGLDKDPFRFTLQTKDRIRLSVNIDKEEFKIVEKAFSEFENNQRVLVECTGVYNKQNKLDSIKDVKTIVLLEKKDVPTQLEGFLNLEEGWMNGEGITYSKPDIAWLSNQFDYYFNRELLLPFTFPMIDGGVQFEWKKEQHDATLEVNLETKLAYFHYYNSATDDDEENEFDLSSQEGWKTLNDKLSDFFKA